jgi:hypothetical protein
MSEKTLRKYVAGLIHGHCSQVESHATANGIPDTNYCIDGVEGWIELKFVRGNDKIKVRPSQASWFKKRLKAGAKNLFFMFRWEYQNLRNHYIIRVRDLAMLERLLSDPTPGAWGIEADGSWAKIIDVFEFNDILRGDAWKK